MSHEVVPGHVTTFAYLQDLFVRGLVGFEASVLTMNTRAAVLFEGIANNGVLVAHGDRGAGQAPGPRPRDGSPPRAPPGRREEPFLLPDVEGGGSRSRRSPRSSRNDFLVSKERADKLSGAWGRHPLLGRMYLPAYRAGTELVARLRRGAPAEKVLPALYGAKGLVDASTLPTLLGHRVGAGAPGYGPVVAGAAVGFGAPSVPPPGAGAAGLGVEDALEAEAPAFAADLRRHDEEPRIREQLPGLDDLPAVRVLRVDDDLSALSLRLDLRRTRRLLDVDFPAVRVERPSRSSPMTTTNSGAVPNAVLHDEPMLVARSSFGVPDGSPARARSRRRPRPRSRRIRRAHRPRSRRVPLLQIRPGRRAASAPPPSPRPAPRALAAASRIFSAGSSLSATSSSQAPVNVAGAGRTSVSDAPLACPPRERRRSTRRQPRRREEVRDRT